MHHVAAPAREKGRQKYQGYEFKERGFKETQGRIDFLRFNQYYCRLDCWGGYLYPVFRTLAHQSSLILLSHRFMVNALIKSRQF